ncbi:hypothetical protein FSW04_16725 [Baekduia soli]|uniref:Uncharacterized protein n=1 Tax=Baekduia soli TaxID=496014 RepID=A0A5B8U7Z0_9ACTN|nr:hypothetical protein [Baekduia soli]QEC49055.1 hypothetical protein FSW04_16725 [Baekduia soli]
MSRYLLASSADAAETDRAALADLCAGLRGDGHEVFWLAPREHRALVLEAGAVHCSPLVAGTTVPDRALGRRARAVVDLQRHVAQVQPDALVTSPDCDDAADFVTRQVPLRWLRAADAASAYGTAGARS